VDDTLLADTGVGEVIRAIGAFLTSVAGPGWPVRYLLVTGDSMAPTLRDGDWVLARRASVARVGEIVLARRGGDPMLLVKRVAALTPAGYWLTGDNPAASTDSRHFGAVPNVVGVLFWRVRPWGRVSGPAPARRESAARAR
jgi:nickel-type superoxide dismutase maturation protease